MAAPSGGDGALAGGAGGGDTGADSGAGVAAVAGREDDGTREFLVLFAHHNMYFNMRFQELEALADLVGGGAVGTLRREDFYVDDPPPTALVETPIALVRLRGGEAAARQICERSILVKAIVEVWTSGETYAEAVAEAVAAGEASRARRRLFLKPPQSFQIRVNAFGRTLTMDEKNETIATLRPLFEGDETCDLQNPDTIVMAIEDHGHRTELKTHLGPRNTRPKHIFVGRQVAGARAINKKLKGAEKPFFQRYELSNRAVLGPTTLDNELSFIMANCAQARSGQLAMEPFCGTGGIMVALSHFGTRVCGGEIDIRVVRGWRIAYVKNKAAMLEVAKKRGLTKALATGDELSASPSDVVASKGCASDEVAASDGQCAQGGASASVGRSSKGPAYENGTDVFTNFIQYGLPTPEVVVCDNSMQPWRTVAGGWCDCIATDPPYGIRAGAKKQGRDSAKPVAIQDAATYIPSKIGYGDDELSQDLLDLAADNLRDGGRIVFLVPVDLADFLGIDRAQAEHGAAPGGPRSNLHDASMPTGGREKDPRLCVPETSRDPLLLDEARYLDFLPKHSCLELVGASLQILSGGLGRLLVTMRRRSRSLG